MKNGRQVVPATVNVAVSGKSNGNRYVVLSASTYSAFAKSSASYGHTFITGTMPSVFITRQTLLVRPAFVYCCAVWSVWICGSAGAVWPYSLIAQLT